MKTSIVITLCLVGCGMPVEEIPETPSPSGATAFDPAIQSGNLLARLIADVPEIPFLPVSEKLAVTNTVMLYPRPAPRAARLEMVGRSLNLQDPATSVTLRWVEGSPSYYHFLWQKGSLYGGDTFDINNPLPRPFVDVICDLLRQAEISLPHDNRYRCL